MVHTENPAAYVGIERVDGTLHGRKGGFVLQHEAGGTDGVPWMTWKIVETTGTGELAGIHGEGQIIIGPNGEPLLHPRIRTLTSGRRSGTRTARQRFARISQALAIALAIA